MNDSNELKKALSILRSSRKSEPKPEPYNIKVKSLLQSKRTKLIEVVSAIQVDKYDGLEIMTQRLCYKGKGDDIEFCVNETYCSYYTVEELYKTFDLVGEDLKLFRGVDYE